MENCTRLETVYDAEGNPMMIDAMPKSVRNKRARRPKFIPVIGHQDKDNINCPFNVAGQMIALRKGGHRVYWNVNGTQAEVFPECPDTGFYALKEIGWYKIGELSPDEEKSAVTRKRRSPAQQPATKRVRKSKKSSDSESEAQSEVESSDSESEVEYDASLQIAQYLPRGSHF